MIFVTRLRSLPAIPRLISFGLLGLLLNTLSLSPWSRVSKQTDFSVSGELVESHALQYTIVPPTTEHTAIGIFLHVSFFVRLPVRRASAIGRCMPIV